MSRCLPLLVGLCVLVALSGCGAARPEPPQPTPTLRKDASRLETARAWLRAVPELPLTHLESQFQTGMNSAGIQAHVLLGSRMYFLLSAERPADDGSGMIRGQAVLGSMIDGSTIELGWVPRFRVQAAVVGETAWFWGDTLGTPTREEDFVLYRLQGNEFDRIDLAPLFDPPESYSLRSALHQNLVSLPDGRLALLWHTDERDLNLVAVWFDPVTETATTPRTIFTQPDMVNQGLATLGNGWLLLSAQRYAHSFGVRPLTGHEWYVDATDGRVTPTRLSETNRAFDENLCWSDSILFGGGPLDLIGEPDVEVEPEVPPSKSKLQFGLLHSRVLDPSAPEWLFEPLTYRYFRGRIDRHRVLITLHQHMEAEDAVSGGGYLKLGIANARDRSFTWIGWVPLDSYYADSIEYYAEGDQWTMLLRTHWEAEGEFYGSSRWATITVPAEYSLEPPRWITTGTVFPSFEILQDAYLDAPPRK